MLRPTGSMQERLRTLNTYIINNKHINIKIIICVINNKYLYGNLDKFFKKKPVVLQRELLGMINTHLVGQLLTLTRWFFFSARDNVHGIRVFTTILIKVKKFV